jgi:hypothetical protein
MNPFKYGQVVGGKDFCIRPELEKTLRKYIEANQNIHVEGERRTGKTSLILETVSQIKVPMIHVDLFQVKSAHDIYSRILDGIITRNSSGSFLKKLMQAIITLRPTMSYDQFTGTPSISIAASQNIMPESIAGLLDFINSRLKTGRLIIFFDEFQDVAELKNRDEILAMMRSKIQLHSDIAYIYAGSIRSQMDKIFYSPGSPFYKSAIPVKVDNINKLTFSNYIIERFKSGDRTIPGECINSIFELTNENPGDVQEFCNALWDTTDDKAMISSEHIHGALAEIFNREKPYYESIMNMVSENQVKCIRGLAEFNGNRVYSQEFLEYTGIGQPASVTRALKRMIKLKVIYNYGSQYKFASPFFRLWLLRRKI